MGLLQPRREHLRRPGCPKSSTFDEKQTCSKISQASDLRKQIVIKTEWKIWDIPPSRQATARPDFGQFPNKGRNFAPLLRYPLPSFRPSMALTELRPETVPTASACRPATDAPTDLLQAHCSHSLGGEMSQIFELSEVADLKLNFASF